MKRYVFGMFAMHWFLIGCMHSPPVGADRGIVSVHNMRLHDDPDIVLNVGVLTGIAIDDHVVLTAAHTFIYEPEHGHPIEINRDPVMYEILADGWDGHRHKMDPRSKNVPDMSIISHDYLLLRTHEAFPDHARLVPVEFDRLGEIRRSTLVTREMWSLDPLMIPISEVKASRDGEWMVVELKSSRSLDVDQLRLSGSPLIAEYRDGTLVLLGIASASGQVFFGSESNPDIKENQVLFTPAYRIPWGALTEN